MTIGNTPVSSDGIPCSVFIFLIFGISTKALFYSKTFYLSCPSFFLIFTFHLHFGNFVRKYISINLNPGAETQRSRHTKPHLAKSENIYKQNGKAAVNGNSVRAKAWTSFLLCFCCCLCTLFFALTWHPTSTSCSWHNFSQLPNGLTLGTLALATSLHTNTQTHKRNLYFFRARTILTSSSYLRFYALYLRARK